MKLQSPNEFKKKLNESKFDKLFDLEKPAIVIDLENELGKLLNVEVDFKPGELIREDYNYFTWEYPSQKLTVTYFPKDTPSRTPMSIEVVIKGKFSSLESSVKNAINCIKEELKITEAKFDKVFGTDYPSRVDKLINEINKKFDWSLEAQFIENGWVISTPSKYNVIYDPAQDDFLVFEKQDEEKDPNNYVMQYVNKDLQMIIKYLVEHT